jgi:HlyD family secretion protein
MRQRELETARARLISPEDIDPLDPDACCIMVRAPIDGQVLAVHHESEQVVSAGTPLIDLGDPSEVEIVAELLSSDAVRVPPGASARIDGWGGPAALAATVRRVEPAGFTKVSALGIEEQRVRVVLDFDDPPETRPGLGHGYRVVAHITVERIDDTVLVPLGALFRRGAQWSVFVVDGDGNAAERPVEIGERTTRQAVVESGLEPGERVILHPSDRVADGVAVEERE